MVARTPPNAKQIIELLIRLKAETPEYPASLLSARKAAFIHQAAALRIQGGGQGGSSGSGGSSTGLGSTTSAQGFLLQAAVGLGLVAAMFAGLLTGSYLIPDKEPTALAENVAAAAETPEPETLPLPSTEPGQTVTATATPTPLVTVTVTLQNSPLVIEDDDYTLVRELIKAIKDNPGLHLGLTPGPPAAPGQGNPGNINKPEKTDRPDKPEKPDKPN